MKNIIYNYSALLIGCSLIGFIGHFIQFGIFRLTPWIPAVVGIALIILSITIQNNKLLYWICSAIIIAFGVLTINMSIEFIPQGFQPLRKKMIFIMMAIASVLTFINLKIKYQQKKASS